MSGQSLSTSQNLLSGSGGEGAAHAQAPPSVVLSVHGSPSSRSYMEQLGIHLNLHGLFAFVLPSPDLDRRQWFRQRVKDIQAADVYVPYVDCSWVHNDETALELYYALRGYLLNGNPVVVPVFDELLLETSEVETVRIRQSLSSSQQELLFQLRDTCASLASAEEPKAAAIQLVNLLVQLGFSLPRKTVATGSTLVMLYEHALKVHSKHKPNSGLSKALFAVERPATLTSLSLARLFIADAGLQAFCESALSGLPCLRELNLSTNGIGAKGVNTLCGHVKYHPSLRRLELSDNDVSQAGASELFFLIRDNQRIVSVTLEKNPIYSEVWLRRVSEALEANKARIERQRRIMAIDAASENQVWTTMWMDQPFLRWRIGVVAHRDETTTMSVRLESASGEVLALETYTGGQEDGNGGERELLVQVFSQIKEFFQRSLMLDTISVQRLNDKHLQFLLESPPSAKAKDGSSSSSNGTAPRIRTVAIAVETMRHCLELDCFRKGICSVFPQANGSSPMAVFEQAKRLVHKVSLRFEDFRATVHSTADDDDVSSAATANQSGAPSSCFVERDLTFWQGEIVSRSIAQVFRWRIGSYAGNMRDEANALLELIAEQEDQRVAGRDVADEEVSHAKLQKLSTVAHGDEQREAHREKGISTGVVSQWKVSNKP